MTKRLLVDATQREEVRVAVCDEKYLNDFDYESTVRKQLKGSIFLAKVTRVEPSLQAAFVNYGGNRHGFLPFSEIHPDYFRIPIADREALIEDQKSEMEALAAQEEAEDSEDEDETEAHDNDAEDDGDEDDAGKSKRKVRKSSRSRDVEMVGGDVAEGERPQRPKLKKNYKIQEVVKRGQIVLVQVQKEERGNKGAAVTTYLSLPGRYCVLMPNSPRGGGVSRKIASFKERRRMRDILKELNVPDGMSVILRTAGVEKTKTEIKRDLDYLMRLWDDIRDLTLKSIAPSCVYEEGSLVMRALRDLYSNDIDEVLVAGEDAYKEARKIMKMLIPSHVKRVQKYEDETRPIFQKYQVETQIAQLSEPVAPLKSGGYIVINPTEALVAIDVNSGKATKERHIEETALRTNLETATEVARQLKLRDLGGLIVIDFIDMENSRNNAKVERALKEALSSDRARIQIGRISNFGLLELSRQRLNPSMTEAQFKVCGDCGGFGYTRTTESSAMMGLRAIEEHVLDKNFNEVTLRVPNEVALYILNNKRNMISNIEERNGITITIEVNNDLTAGTFEMVVDGNDIASSDPVHFENPNNNDNQKKTKRGKRGGRKRNDRNSNNRNQKNNNSDDDSSDDEDGSDDNAAQQKKSNRSRKNSKKSDKNQNDEGDNSSKSDSSDTQDDKKDEKASGRKKSTRSRKSKSSKSDDKTDKDNAKEASNDSSAPEEAKDNVAQLKASDDTNSKKSSKKESAQKSRKNDDNEAPQNKDYEVVNEAPKKKKKGWWSK